MQRLALADCQSSQQHLHDYCTSVVSITLFSLPICLYVEESILTGETQSQEEQIERHHRFRPAGQGNPICRPGPSVPALQGH